MPSKKCQCGKFSTFGIPGERPTHCKGCKEDGMEDVISKRCLCGKHPVFGILGHKPTHCGQCKKDDMINVVVKRCTCGKCVSFGFPGKKPTHCDTCKQDGMVNVRNTKCLCGKQPVFGLSGERPTHCAICKTPGMINVVAKVCHCGKQPAFGFPGERPTHCRKCMEPGMKDVISKTCICGKRASFGYSDGIPSHCVQCKEYDMEDVRSKRCPGYDGNPCREIKILCYGREYCLECDPDTSRRLYRKRDEAAFFNFLKKYGIEITQREFPVHYRCIDTNRKMAFVDGIIITKNNVVCLELDEDAHEWYGTGCDETRMHNVSAELKIAYPYHSIAWVRVNPHTKKNGKRDTSYGATKIRNQRHQEALEIIKDILENPRDCIEYVGYDV
ncbi:hypothetical protein ATCVNTS1_422R [Acanthocystis turfacea Chlorella virus NTS-1]|nr:hypothetical protein ATCVNTS1_422R [Acanthocystis turfacea Chlorella virus NTS-1]